MDVDEFRATLLGWYRRNLGTPDTTTQVYVGFALFFAGVALTVVAVGTFLWSTTYPPEDLAMYAIREVAGVAGALGLPAVLVGATVLLPVDRRGRYAAAVGALVCVGATAAFVRSYPYNWNVTGADASAWIVPLYAGGIVVVTGATGAALVTFHLERARGTPAADADATTDADAERETVSEERVRRDIDEAMDGAELSWGGVEKTDTRRLQLNTDADVEAARGNLDGAAATETRSSGRSVDDAVSGLDQLRGGQKQTASGSGTDDQASALRELRAQQRNQGEDGDDGLVDRLRDLGPW